ncbi:MAG: leucine-rich repeat protein [Clostridia bacterium]|nr:leucine-rich repeat protein [Clostridia bacterium]
MRKHIGKITISLAICVLVIASILCITIFSNDTESEPIISWAYTVDTTNKTATITGFSYTGSYTRQFNIPATVTKDGVEYQVTSIKESAFNGKTNAFGNLTLPEGLVTIGKNAFKGTQIYGEVVIPSTVTSIGESAFENCKGITSVVLPENLTTLSPYVFKSCTALRTINTENVEEFKKECFNNCHALYYMSISNKARVIEDSAFSECRSLDQAFDISSVTTLGNKVFYNCSRIEGFIMPDVDFDLGFFSGCTGIKSYAVKDSNTKYITKDGVIFDKATNGSVLLLYPANKDDKIYTIPSNVVEIAKGAFAYTTVLEQVVISENVTKISAEAFKYSSIKNAYIPDNVNSVSVDIFKGCSSLEWVILGTNISAIGVDSFKDANSSVTVIAKNPDFPKPDYVNNFISLSDYQCIDHYYGFLDKEATCTEFGYNQCIVCNRITYVKELGHSGAIVEKSKLSCTTDEYQVVSCSRCGEKVKDTTQTAPGHTTIKQTIAPTSSRPGYTVNKCIVCYETYIDNYSSYTDVTPCTRHSNFGKIEISQASCSTNGLTVHYCGICGTYIRSTTSPKTACNFEVTFEAISSCTVNGQIIEDCTVCDNQKITSLPLKEHSHDWYTISEKQGYEYSTCSVCGVFESREVDYSVLNSLIGLVSKYYETYYAPDTVALIRPILETNDLNLTQEAVDYNAKLLSTALANISYNVTDVPVVFIEKDSVLDKNYTDAKIYIASVDENGKSKVEAIEYNATMKIRGNTTANSNKYPYNIKFSSKVDLFGMGAGKKYCLLANLFDQTLMRNAMAIEFSQAIGIQFAPSYQFVEVYYNGRYDGLYMLTTPMDIGENRIDIDEDNDYLFELENKSDGEFYLKSPVLGINALIEDTADLSGEAYSRMYSTFNMIDYAIKSGDWELIQEYVDIESVAKFYVIHEYLKEVDICYDSTRFYIKDGKLHGGPVWDFDLGMGNIDSNGGDSDSHSAYWNKGTHATANQGVEGNSATGYWADIRWSSNKNIWFAHLMKYSPEFQETVKQIIIDYTDEMRLMYEDKVISKREVIENKIDVHHQNEAFTNARIRNYQRFNVAHAYSGMTHLLPSYSAAIDYMRDWFAQRHAWMYEAYVGQELPPADNGK